MTSFLYTFLLSIVIIGFICMRGHKKVLRQTNREWFLKNVDFFYNRSNFVGYLMLNPSLNMIYLIIKVNILFSQNIFLRRRFTIISFFAKNLIISLVWTLISVRNTQLSFLQGRHIYIYIYIYIYIVIHKQTISLYQNSSVWLDPQDTSSRDRNPADFTSVGYLTPERPTFSA